MGEKMKINTSFGKAGIEEIGTSHLLDVCNTISLNAFWS